MPRLVTFLMRHAAIGFAIAVLFVGALLALDARGLGTLVRHAPDGWLAASVLTFAMGLTFSSVQMGVAVMLLAARDAGSGGHRHRMPLGQKRAVPAPAPARSRASRR